ncbi:MAG TPA: BolA family transcriptional regulator [Thiotrichales bacterium]|nr:BolA family transcriptional regulator [Thiotrichales bacterium]
MNDRVERIRARLESALQPVRLEIRDDSAKHAGHAGARGGGGHYILTIVSPAFVNRSPIERHRMVYDALGDMMASEIHALSIDARAPDED